MNNRSSNKFVLVTGGAGYIGSHACKALFEKGFTPITFDNLKRGNSWAVKWGPLEQGDLKDQSNLDYIFKKYNPLGVMHFAAYCYVEESTKDPMKYYDNNVTGTLNLLNVMKNNNVNKIIFSSTCATYGIPNSVPITEAHPQKPINPYGMTKLIIEQMLKDFSYSYGLKSISLRYFNAAGADEDFEIGEHHVPETHLIPLVLEAAIDNKKTISVYGNDYETPDGTCVRDYIHVDDIADAHLLSLQSLINGAGTTAYNLGNENGFSVLDVIKASEKVTKKSISMKIAKRRLGDPAYLVGSSNLIKKQLGWKPRYTDLEKIINTAFGWHLNFNKLNGKI